MNSNTATLENDIAGIFDFLTELNHFTPPKCVFFKGGNAPPPGRFNPPIAFMAVCDVSEQSVGNFGSSLDFTPGPALHILKMMFTGFEEGTRGGN